MSIYDDEGVTEEARKVLGLGAHATEQIVAGRGWWPNPFLKAYQLYLAWQIRRVSKQVREDIRKARQS